MNNTALETAAYGASCTPAEFREGMRHLIGGVTIVCTRHDGKLYGLTATAVCSVSVEPPLLLVCLNAKGSTGNAIIRSGSFSVNLINSEQRDLALRFAQPVVDGDRFNAGSWTLGSQGTPLLLGCPASFQCRLIHQMKAGSHYVLIGQVETVSTCSRMEPLGYLRGEFGALTRVDAD